MNLACRRWLPCFPEPSLPWHLGLAGRRTEGARLQISEGNGSSYRRVGYHHASHQPERCGGQGHGAIHARMMLVVQGPASQPRAAYLGQVRNQGIAIIKATAARNGLKLGVPLPRTVTMRARSGVLMLNGEARVIPTRGGKRAV